MTQTDIGSEHPLVGQTIASKYKIVRLLGEGGMGCVYLGEQQLGTTTRKVAVKTLHKHLSHDASIKARFQREVGTVAALEHPNTIQVFDFGAMEDGTLYIVMEFVQGRSVADILEKDGAMPPPRVEHILRQVVGSLEEAHSHGIVHRDLKPDNVVLCERAGQKDWVEVLDFGIAKRSSEHDPNEAKLTQQGMVLGTPPYMSPEQFTGQPVDVRSDIYALGVMAYEMLTGRLPWEANTAWEWASKHMTEPPTPLERQPLGPHVPQTMRDAITRALAKDTDHRFGSVREFFEAFSGSALSALPQQNGGTAALYAAPTPVGSTSGPGRAKTEMGAPVMMGGPPHDARTPASFAASPAVVPAGPAHAPQKKGGAGLIIGLAALAGILIIAALGVLVFRGKPKPSTTTSLDFGTASATAASSMVHTDEPPPVISSAAPLDPGNPKTAINTPTAASPANTKTATKPTPTPTPTPKPVPTPQPQPNASPECESYRKAVAGGKVKGPQLAVLEARCREKGGP
jgi:eukaryotic-like serine/threonine-protein kinase